MTDIAKLVDRLRNQWLEPPDELWPRTALTAAVDDSATILAIDLALLSPEERHLVSTGLLAEIDSEEVIFRGLSASNATVVRGARGSAKVDHPNGATVFLKPPWTRREMFDTLADAIVACCPPLYRLVTTTVTVGDDGIIEVPANVITPVSLRATDDYGSWPWEDLGAWTPSATGRAIRVRGVASGTEALLQYRAVYGHAAAETDTLATLGLPGEFAEVVILKAASRLIGSRALSVRQQEFISQQLAAESYPAETPTRVSTALLRMYAIALDDARKALTFRHPEIPQMQLSP